MASPSYSDIRDDENDGRLMHLLLRVRIDKKKIGATVPLISFESAERECPFSWVNNAGIHLGSRKSPAEQEGL